MKRNYYPLLIILIAFLLCLNIFMYMDTQEQLQSYHQEPPVLIWNDDHESIPMDNTPVLLEFSSKNSDTLYLGPIPEPDNSAEYQFIVVDDSVIIKDYGRKVGTIKLEGQLKDLIEQDNL